jgi:hypothetical protein
VVKRDRTAAKPVDHALLLSCGYSLPNIAVQAQAKSRVRRDAVGVPPVHVGSDCRPGTAKARNYRPANSSQSCLPSEPLIRAKAQTLAAFLPSSTCESCDVVNSERSESCRSVRLCLSRS